MATPSPRSQPRSAPDASLRDAVPEAHSGYARLGMTELAAVPLGQMAGGRIVVVEGVALKEEAARLVHAALAHRALKGSIRCVWEAPGVSFDPACVAAVRSATAALGFDSLEMVSGAGHDSCNLSAVVPTAMVFVPCAGGLSHNEAESALPADLAAGADVLLHAMLSMAAG